MILPRTSPTGLSLAHSYFSNSSFLQGNRKGSPGWRYSELSATVQIPGLQRATRPRDLRNDPEITGRKPIERPTLLRPSGKPPAPPPPPRLPPTRGSTPLRLSFLPPRQLRSRGRLPAGGQHRGQRRGRSRPAHACPGTHGRGTGSANETPAGARGGHACPVERELREERREEKEPLGELRGSGGERQGCT